MRFSPSLWLLFVCFGAVAGRAEALPKTLGYTFFISGEPAGRADIKITETKNELIFESQTRVLTGLTVVALTARTVADPKTFAVRDFSYQGTKGDHTVACEAHVRGDSVYGFVDMDGKITDRHLKMTQAQTVLFEDWLMEHEILIALAQAKSKKQTTTFGMVFTASLQPADVTTGFSGEVLVEAGDRSMTARKLVVIIRGAEPFESHVDPVRLVPVYLKFPTSRSEAFLDEVFGDNPVSRFPPTKDPQE